MAQELSSTIGTQADSSSSNFQQSNEKNERIKKTKQTKKRARKTQRRRMPWSQIENINYYAFIVQHSETLEQKQKKSKQKIFNKMSARAESRTSRQCKSHHQKLLAKYQTIENVLLNLGHQRLSSSTSCNIEQSDQLYCGLIQLDDLEVENYFHESSLGEWMQKERVSENNVSISSKEPYDHLSMGPTSHDWRKPQKFFLK